jgi:hypothetical protein
MKTIAIMGALTLMAALPLAVVGTTGTKEMSADRKVTENVDDTIRYLLDFVSKSDCTFIRNGVPHTGKEAANHFRSKYEHFESEIKTPEDFIQMSATKSMITGKPYLVKTTEGTVIPCADWLGKVLADYRKR